MKILERLRKVISGAAIFALIMPVLFMGATPTMAIPASPVPTVPTSTVVKWDFADQNTTADGGIAANLAKTITSVNTNLSYNYYNGASGGVNDAISTDGWQFPSLATEKYWQVELSTAGFENLSFSSRQRSSATGPKSYAVDYKVGAAGSWTNVVPSLAVTEDFNTGGAVGNQALPTAANNKASIYIRWNSLDSAVNNPAGTNRIDNIVVTGTEMGTGAYFLNSTGQVRENNAVDMKSKSRLSTMTGTKDVRFYLDGSSSPLAGTMVTAGVTTLWYLNQGLPAGQHILLADYSLDGETYRMVSIPTTIYSLDIPWFNYILPASAGQTFRSSDNPLRIRIDDEFRQVKSVTYEVYNYNPTTSTWGSKINDFEVLRSDCDLRQQGLYVICDAKNSLTWPTLTEGYYRAKVKSADYAGGGLRTIQPGTNSEYFYIDATSPTISDLTIDNINPTYPILSKTVKSSALANDNMGIKNVEFYITAPRVSDGACDGNGTHLASAASTTPNVSGRYVATVDTSALNGNYCLNANAEDMAGSHSPILKQQILLDNTAPVVNLDEPTATFVRGTIDIRGTVTDEHPHHYYLVIKNTLGQVKAKVDSDGTINRTDSFTNELLWQFDTTTLADGNYIIDLEARDSANNKDANSVKTHAITIDNTSPTINFVSPTPTDGLLTSQSSQTFTVESDSDTESCQIDFAGGSGSYVQNLIPNSYVGQTGNYVISGDDSATSYTLPFSFPFYGNNYSTVYVSTNGLINFTYQDNSLGNSDIEVISRTATVGLWDDIVTNVYAENLGDHVKFHWTGYRYGRSGSSTVNFELSLYQSGRITMSYGDNNLGAADGSVGISSGDGVNYILAPYNLAGTLNYPQTLEYVAEMGGDMAPNGSGQWSRGISGIPDGMQTYSVTCVDHVGNTTTTPNRTLTVDTTGPSTPGTPVDNKDNPTNQKWVTWSWDASSDLYSGINRYEWSLEKDGLQVANNHVASGTTSKTRQLTWGDGSYVFKVYAVDGLGNVSATATSDSLTLDTTDPETPTILQPSDGYATSNANPYLDWTDTADTEQYRYQICYNNPDIDGYCTEERKVTLSVSERTLINPFAEGKYWWRVRSIDYAGNISPWSPSNNLIIDQTAPNSSVDTLPQYINTEKFNINVTSNDPAPGSIFSIQNLVADISPIETQGSGVQYVELWYRKDGSSCTTITADSLVMATVVDDCQDGYTRYPGEFDPTQPIEFDTSRTGGDGFYEFFSIAVDNADNRESAPMDSLVLTSIQGLVLGGIVQNERVVPDTSTTVDTAKPVITLVGSDPMTVSQGSIFTDPGANTDDGTTVVESGAVNTAVLGSYTRYYDATDSAGNVAVQKTRTVNIVDTTAPIITLTGNAAVSLTVGGTFTDSGATTNDGSAVTTTGAVNTAIAGVYVLTYNSTDGSGNAATPVTRTVTVNALPLAAVFDTGGGSGTGEAGEAVAGATTENQTSTPVITPSGNDSNDDVKGAEDSPNWWSTTIMGLARWLWAMLALIIIVGLGYWWLILGRRRRNNT